MAVDYPFLPSLEDVADYVPTRTIPENLPGEDDPLGTFTADTTPTAEAVDRLILKAAAQVAAVFSGTVPSSAYDEAQAATAIRTAAFVELAYPRRDADVNVASQLFAEANKALDRARTAADTAPDSTTATIPVYEFPDPVAYGDVTVI